MSTEVSFELLESAIMSADIGFIVFGKEGTILVWNDWMANHSRIPSDHARGKTIEEVFVLGGTSRIVDAVWEALNKGKSTLLSQSFNPHHLPLYRKIGQDMLMTQRIVVRAQNLHETRICILEVTDQSAGFEREKYLASTKNYIRRVIESIQDLMIIVDQENIIRDVNKIAYDTLGYDKSELVGRPFATIIPDGGDIQIWSKDGIHDKRSVIKDTELKLKKKNGDLVIVFLSGSFINHQTSDDIRFVGIAKDITVRRKTEEELEAKRGQLVSASKLSALGEMAGGVAHEINNPVAIIHGLSNNLKKHLKVKGSDEKSDKIIDNIIETTVRITKIIKGLKTISRSGEKDEFEEVNIADILNDTLALCSESFKISGIDLKICDIPQNLVLDCRQTQISQVLLNLLNNAKDAVMESEERWVKLDIKLKDKHALISVEDSGMGIPKDVQERLFEPFFTTKPAGQGTGLGLSISKSLVEDHGGQFYLDDNAKNTKFMIVIPLQQSEDAA